MIPLFPTPLRPLSPALHTLAYDSLCDSNCSIALLDAGAALFVSLYLLAPKGRDGLRDAWRKGVEALIGSIDTLVLNVTSDIFAEGERKPFSSFCVLLFSQLIVVLYFFRSINKLHLIITCITTTRKFITGNCFM